MALPVSRNASRKPPRVLCVDDDQFVLKSIQRMLYTGFDVHVVSEPILALKMLDESRSNPFAVVISDLEMPGLNGVALLKRAREMVPDTVRVLLTGHANVDGAIGAVNDGAVFRFLTKPCRPEALISTVGAAAEQHRLIVSEQELLEKTLHGSVKALTDILTLVSPSAFACGMRLKRYVERVSSQLEVPNQWEIEVAALLSRLGSVSLPSEIGEKLNSGRELNDDEKHLADTVPSMTASLLAEIPRLEGVHDILIFQNEDFDAGDRLRGESGGGAIPLGARILKIANDLDVLEAGGMTPTVAIGTLYARIGAYDPRVLAAFKTTIDEDAHLTTVRQMRLGEVCIGMVFAEDVRSPTGLLLAARGQDVGRALTQRLRYSWPEALLDQEVLVIIPSPDVA